MINTCLQAPRGRPRCPTTPAHPPHDLPTSAASRQPLCEPLRSTSDWFRPPPPPYVAVDHILGDSQARAVRALQAANGLACGTERAVQLGLRAGHAAGPTQGLVSTLTAASCACAARRRAPSRARLGARCRGGGGWRVCSERLAELPAALSCTMQHYPPRGGSLELDSTIGSSHRCTPWPSIAFCLVLQS